jgi:hypothetical protein
VDSFELTALAVGAAVILVVIVIVLVLPALGGDPDKSTNITGSGD